MKYNPGNQVKTEALGFASLTPAYGTALMQDLTLFPSVNCDTEDVQRVGRAQRSIDLNIFEEIFFCR